MHRIFRQFSVKRSVKIRFLKTCRIWGLIISRYRLFLPLLKLQHGTTWQMSLKTMFLRIMTLHNLVQWMICWLAISTRAIPVNFLITADNLICFYLQNRSLTCKLHSVRNWYLLKKLTFRSRILYRFALAIKIKIGLRKVICLPILSMKILKCHLPLPMQYLAILMKSSIQNVILLTWRQAGTRKRILRLPPWLTDRNSVIPDVLTLGTV